MTAERVTYIENSRGDVKWVSRDSGWYTNVEAFIIRDNGEILPLPSQPNNCHLVFEAYDGDVPVTPVVTYPFSPEEPAVSFTCDDETLVFHGDELVPRYDDTELDTTEECEAFLEACLAVAQQFLRSTPRPVETATRGRSPWRGTKQGQIPRTKLSVWPTVRRCWLRHRLVGRPRLDPDTLGLKFLPGHAVAGCGSRACRVAGTG